MRPLRLGLVVTVALLAASVSPALARPPYAYDQSEAVAPPPPIVIPPVPPRHRPPRPPCPWHPRHPLAMPDAPRGRLTLVTRPFAAVTIDGRLVGHTPLVGFHLDPGTHTIVLRADCGSLRRRIDVTPATDIQLSLQLCGLSPR